MSLLEDFRALKAQVDALAAQVEQNRTTGALHEEQINGERGLSATIDALTVEVKGLRKAAYWLAALIVSSSIAFAFSVLTVFSG